MSNGSCPWGSTEGLTWHPLATPDVAANAPPPLASGKKGNAQVH
jgi:hypothetical protein